MPTDLSPDALRAALDALPLYAPTGRVLEAHGSSLVASLPGGRIGELCEIHDPDTGRTLEAEIVGFRDGLALLAPSDDLAGLSLGARIRLTGRTRTVPAGDGLLGRVVDAAIRPIDGRGPVLDVAARLPLHRDPPAAMSRALVNRPFRVGVRAIDGLLTCGVGQRVGVFGEPGCGKSMLLASLVQGSEADVCVVGLIGERGREVREFVEDTLGAQAMARSTVVVATSDRPAVERAQAAYAATAVAEHFRDRGKRVLLVIDSLTRFARALRDIGLAAGEVPTRRGFPPSVFAALPSLLERAGTAKRGSITAFHTILLEGDGTGDPIAEEVRSILDGHVMLSSELAARAHYPAIDVLRSRSRVMPAVADAAHKADAARFLELRARHDDVAFLVRVGEYQAGSDPVADRAIAQAPAMDAFLKQPAGERSAFDATRAALTAAVGLETAGGAADEGTAA